MKSFLLKPLILSLSFAFAVQSAVASGDLHEALSKRIDDHTVYEEFAQSLEGRQKLRSYRKDGKSLYAYFTEKAAKDISSSYKKILTNLLPAYFEGPVPSAHELDIQDHLGGLVDAPESFLTAYRNSQGHNVAVLAAKGGSSNLLKVMRDKGANVAAMLDNFVSTSIEHIADALFEIAPGLLVKSHFSDQITRLMVLALDDPAQYLGRTGYTGHKEPGLKEKLEHRGIKFDQKDIAGNTADSLAELVIGQDRKHAQQRSILKVASGVLGEHYLDSHFWKRVTENPYGQLLGSRNPQAFVDIALNAVLSQKQTPVRASFLQQNLSHGAEASELWSSFLKTHDALESQKSERLPDVLRVLKVVRDFEDRNVLDGVKEEEIRTLQSNIFANGGTFGVNFRKANRDEVELMISILTSLGRQKVKSGDSAHEIANSFFKSSSHPLNREQEAKLESHQINCAVMALHSAIGGDFNEIDNVLQSRSYSAVTYGSSRQRYDELMAMAG